MKIYFLIPARSGSKGLPNKNVLFLNNKPMAQYSIDAAIESNLTPKENIFLSTDSEIYVDLFKELNISTHFRDETTASDNSPSSAFILDFIGKHIVEENAFICLLQPTSPLRDSVEITNAFELLNVNNAKVLYSVNKVDKSPSLFGEIENNKIPSLVGIDKNYRRQNETKELFMPNGAIFITTKQDYLKNQSFFTEEAIVYEMDKLKSVDVDNYIDFCSCIGILSQQHSSRKKKTINEQKIALEKYCFGENENIILGDSRLEGIANSINFNGFLLESFVKSDLRLNSRDITISLGINDLKYGTSPSEIISLFKELETNLVSKGNKVRFALLTPTLYRMFYENTSISEINEQMIKNFNTINLNGDLIDKNGNLKKEYTKDGIHFNESGKEIVRRNLQKELKWRN